MISLVSSVLLAFATLASPQTQKTSYLKGT